MNEEVEPSSQPAEILPWARFTTEEIQLCLKELKAQDNPSGLELKDFLSELEHLVEDA
jgi:hypothetical protein